MKLIGFLGKKENRTTVFKDKNKYIFCLNGYKEFYTKSDFEKKYISE